MNEDVTADILVQCVPTVSFLAKLVLVQDVNCWVYGDQTTMAYSYNYIVNWVDTSQAFTAADAHFCYSQKNKQPNPTNC